jgi:hypothetical protein
MPSPAISIIVEWDNIRLAELGRCRAMLREVARQASELRHTGCRDVAAAAGSVSPADAIELLVLYDSERIHRGAVESVLHAELGPAPAALAPRAIAAPGMAYYALKNFGVAHAAGAVVVFVDSDVIPEPGWLAELLAPLAREEVQFVGGNTYVDATGLYSKAVALTWFFPLRETGTDLRTANRFFANNFAARRALLAAHPFPLDEGAARGSCLALSRKLTASGITIYRNPAAQASHPAPKGLARFVVRALADGRDYWIHAASADRGVRSVARHFYYEMRRAVTAVRTHGSAVRLTRAGVPAAAAIGAGYYLLGFAASLATRAHPAFMKRRFQL